MLRRSFESLLNDLDPLSRERLAGVVVRFRQVDLERWDDRSDDLLLANISINLAILLLRAR